ncbi:MAG: UTP-glucose-1-phosphate uridylyltransferase [Parcubacteria group bacterium GW2011_GWA2_47_16]|nr:MAG: UTP-glucose-1-phosphate uridylyltransferase [Parcubacteria group bacterium GW2011_GWA2_47_16]
MIQKVTKAIIPVAGLGTRFLPATKAQPKEMLPIMDKPAVQYLVEEAVAAGITDIIFVTGRDKRTIEDHFDVAPGLERMLEEKGKMDAAKLVHNISNLARFAYVRQKYPKGDGDAILTAAHLIGDEPVAVLFGDDLILSDTPALKQLMNVYEKYGKPMVALAEVSDEVIPTKGIVRGDKVTDKVFKIKETVEKPKLADAPSNLAVVGKYIITPEIIEALKKVRVKEDEELRLAHALDAVAKKGDVYGVKLEGEWLDCGSKIGFLRATVRYGLLHPETENEFKNFLKGLRF